MEEAIRIDPHQPALYTNLSLGYLLLRDFGTAERVARMSVDLDRTSVHARLILVLVLSHGKSSLTE